MVRGKRQRLIVIQFIDTGKETETDCHSAHWYGESQRQRLIVIQFIDTGKETETDSHSAHWYGESQRQRLIVIQLTGTGKVRDRDCLSFSSLVRGKRQRLSFSSLVRGKSETDTECHSAHWYGESQRPILSVIQLIGTGKVRDRY